MTTLTDTMRNAELKAIVDQLKEQRDRRADYVVPATAIRAENGLLHINGGGVDTILRPTPIMVDTMGANSRLDMPTRHMREFHAEHPNPDIALANLAAFDAVVNARLTVARTEGRSYTVRTFTPGPNDGGIGVARAMVSDKYEITDNYDTLFSALDGVKASGVKVGFEGGDLTETRMRLRFSAPTVNYMATEWLKNYRNPYGNGPGSHSGFEQGEEPIVFAGFEIANSETGMGALTVCPRFVIQICRNGARITKHVVRQIHAGGRLDHGQIDFAADTHRTALELTSKIIRDAIARFLDADFVEACIRELEAESATPIPPGAATDIVAEIKKAHRWSEAEADDILGAFIGGGQLTAGGVMQAVTAAAQRVGDPERAATLEEQAVDVMHDAARLARVGPRDLPLALA